MKINASTYIMISFCLFMIFITTLVIKTYQMKVDLVSEDYYGQELKYQEKINKMNHVKNQLYKISWKQDSLMVILSFPANSDTTGLHGHIEFYRPSDSSKDLVIPLHVGTGNKQNIDKKLLISGLYKMKIDWQVNGIDYYTEEDIYIQ